MLREEKLLPRNQRITDIFLTVLRATTLDKHLLQDDNAFTTI